MKRPDDRTVPNEVPPMHVLVAAERQDRKETEDLLAGFDRPGRGPKKPGSERDFVDYYAKKKNGPDSGRGPSSGPAVVMGPRQIDVVTVVKPRKTEGTPGWVVWLGAAVLMLGVGGAVAFIATSDARPNAKAPTGPSATTTISAATPLPSGRDVIPPPAPPEPTTTTTTPMTVSEPAPVVDAPAPRPSGRRDPKAAPGAASTTAATANPTTTSQVAAPKPPPRDDFIRDM